MLDKLSEDFTGDRSLSRCGICFTKATPKNPIFQLSCARPLCVKKHTDTDGEVIDCAEHGPIVTHFNVTRCRKCGGSRAVAKAMKEHQQAHHPKALPA